MLLSQFRVTSLQRLRATPCRTSKRPHQQYRSRVLQPQAIDHSGNIHFVATKRDIQNSISTPYFQRRPTSRTLPRVMTNSRSHAGHHHHHHHDNTYLISKNKKDAGVRITRIGLYSNLGMALAKGIGGYIFHSQSMIADAWVR
jgi:hypothetical protein